MHVAPASSGATAPIPCPIPASADKPSLGRAMELAEARTKALGHHLSTWFASPDQTAAYTHCRDCHETVTATFDGTVEAIAGAIVEELCPKA